VVKSSKIKSKLRKKQKFIIILISIVLFHSTAIMEFSLLNISNGTSSLHPEG